MPEKIMRCVGLSFSKEELEKMLGIGKLDLDDEGTFFQCVDFLVEAHENNKFEEFGFSEDCYLDEISGDAGGLFMQF